jgi:hypothetical protein
MTFELLTFIVIMNVAATVALWSAAARRPAKPKKKFVKRLLQSEPITPKHQQPKTIGGEFGSLVSKEDRLFFEDFADFGVVVNWWLADEYVGRRWRLQELPETELTLHGVFDHGPTFGRSYAVFYNQVQVGELELEPFGYRADRPKLTTHIHLEYVRLLAFSTIRDFLAAIAMHTCDDSRDSAEYFEAQQTIDRALTEALWQINQVDVYGIGAPDDGEVNLRLEGTASWYLDRRQALRNKAAPRSV